jgi:hypothetical protein
VRDTEVVELLRETGPLTGAELQAHTDMKPLDLWRFCTNDPRVSLRVVGNRYLRLDRAVSGYARLSPSIRREFLTYTLLDLAGAKDRLAARAEELSTEIVCTSEAKRRLALQTVSTLVEGLECAREIKTRTCFILAGDIVHAMAHRVPRPERSTGRLVRGSDLDVIVVTADSLDPKAREALDEAMHHKKYMLLINPSYREELDYIIKDLRTVKEQVGFDTFEHMVACKILDEGEFLGGSRDLFNTVKGMLRSAGIPERLAGLKMEAAAHRARAEEILRQAEDEVSTSSYLNLFFTSDEGDELY